MRCLQVDNTINDLLDRGINVMSPATSNERKKKQLHWDVVQANVVPDWASSLQDRKRRAMAASANNHQAFLVQSLPAAEDTSEDVVIVSVNEPPGEFIVIPMPQFHEV